MNLFNKISELESKLNDAIPQDKQLHALYALAFTAGLRRAGMPRAGAFVLVLLAGIVKEVADGGRNTLSEHAADVLAVAIGAAVGCI